MSLTNIKYSKDADLDFYKTLQKRVKSYFDDNKISRHANFEMVIKTISMFALYLTPYFLMMLGVVSNPWLIFLMWTWMGVGMAGIGFSVMHDANHGAYSSNKTVNSLLGAAVNLIGGNAIIWKIQHNVLHHTYTNIDGMDEDISPKGGILRFSPFRKRYSFHKLQHIYAWFLYGVMTLFWISSKEFLQLVRYKDMGLTKRFGSIGKLLFSLSIWKIIYYVYALVLPLIFLPIAWWMILGGFIFMHFVTGLILGSVFQVAHVMPEMEFPLADDEGNMENNFAVHQLLTTTDFSPNSKILSWYVGGLNYQIEHHLFPNICHIHYKKLSGIVKKTADEFNLPYHVKPDFFTALKEHTKMLFVMGHYDRFELSQINN